MREVSDRLCREARISVIDHPDGKKKNYGEWVAEKNGKPTVRDTIRADIDRAILASTTERDFISVMEEMGYKIETKTETGAPRQHPIVILHGKKHFRLYYGGRKKREVNCLADECVCKAELQEAARRERKENGSKNQ